MKFINYLTSISGVEIYPLISLLVFFTFFTGLVFFVWKADKSYINKLSELPLDINMEDSEKHNHKQR